MSCHQTYDSKSCTNFMKITSLTILTQLVKFVVPFFSPSLPQGPRGIVARSPQRKLCIPCLSLPCQRKLCAAVKSPSLSLPPAFPATKSSAGSLSHCTSGQTFQPACLFPTHMQRTFCTGTFFDSAMKRAHSVGAALAMPETHFCTSSGFNRYQNYARISPSITMIDIQNSSRETAHHIV